jgi:acyl carrier protein
MDELIHQLKIEIISCLNLEGLSPEEIDATQPLFNEGLGLDSIDALELIVLMDKTYGLKIVEASKGKEIFYSVGTMAKYIMENTKS